MKVLHLGLYDRHGGACIAAYRQHQALLREGVDSQMWVRFKTTADSSVHAYTPSPEPFVRIRRIFQRHFFHAQHRHFVKRGVFLDDRSEDGGAELVQMPKADVINLQSFWNFVHLPAILEAIPPSVPVVVTMHEMAPFTGGCDYAGDCSRFHEQCGNCPLMGGRQENDLSRRSWNRKQRVFHSRPAGKICFVADSHWLAAAAQKSGLLSGLPVSVIHYGLDTEVFRPLDRSFARTALGIPAGAKVLSFAASFVNDARKGMKHLVDAIRLLPQKPFLLMWGNHLPPVLGDIPHRHLGGIHSEHLAALAYNASDVFVMPSLEEAFGQTALEAVACGIPVVAFAAGGIPDIVRHEVTGLLTPVGNSQLLGEAIQRILEDQNLRNELSFQGRRWALQHFSMANNASQYLKLYHSLLDETASK